MSFQRLSSVCLRALICFACLFGLMTSSGMVGCGGGCGVLSETYALTGCLGEETCKTIQTDCQVRFECASAFQFCQGFMVGREINMRCAANDGHNFQAIIGVRDDFLQGTFVKAGKVCQGKLTPSK